METAAALLSRTRGSAFGGLQVIVALVEASARAGTNVGSVRRWGEREEGMGGGGGGGGGKRSCRAVAYRGELEGVRRKVCSVVATTRSS